MKHEIKIELKYVKYEESRNQSSTPNNNKS